MAPVGSGDIKPLISRQVCVQWDWQVCSVLGGRCNCKLQVTVMTVFVVPGVSIVIWSRLTVGPYRREEILSRYFHYHQNGIVYQVHTLAQSIQYNRNRK